MGTHTGSLRDKRREIFSPRILGASPPAAGSGFPRLRYHSGPACGVAATHLSNPLRSGAGARGAGL
jgi:hypothetical protein